MLAAFYGFNEGLKIGENKNNFTLGDEDIDGLLDG
jgi:hypothetical protein